MEQIRLLAKLGVSYRNDPWAVGLAVTTPGLALWGTGQAGYDRALMEQGFGLTPPAPVFNFQDSLSARFRSTTSGSLASSVWRWGWSSG